MRLINWLGNLRNVLGIHCAAKPEARRRKTLRRVGSHAPVSTEISHSSSAIETLEERVLLASTPVTITISQYVVSDTEDLSAVDVRAVVTIGGQVLPPSSEIAAQFARPDDWKFDAVVDFDSDNPIVPVTIRLFDDDNFLNGGDNSYDISPLPGERVLSLSLDPFTGRFYDDSGVVRGLNGSSFVESSGNGDGDAIGSLRLSVSVPFADRDSDGDGLYDRWETEGIDSNMDGVVDLRLQGADPLHKDLFVEVDAMTGLAPDPLPPITGATMNPGGQIIITSSGHGLTTGTRVRVQGVLGNTAANGVFTVTRLDSDNFRLEGSVGSGTFMSSPGARWSLADLEGTGLATGTSLDLVIDAFRKAPVLNPDGSFGINLHVELDEQMLSQQAWNVLMDSTDLMDSIDSTDGDFVGSWDFDLDGDGLGPRGEDLDADGTFMATEDADSDGVFDAGDPDEEFGGAYLFRTKNARFGTAAERAGANSVALIEAKRLTHRYSVFAHSIVGSRPLGSDGSFQGVIDGFSGVAPNGSDFVVSFGDDTWTDYGGQVDQQAGTFMHELGHALGLGHGGAVSLSGYTQANLTGPANLTVLLGDAYTNQLFAGMSVSGIGIPAGTTIAAVNPGNRTITLSNAPLYTGTFDLQFDDAINYKPNYPSVMNYTWQLPANDYSNYDASWELSYSSGRGGQLNEAILNESQFVNFGKPGRAIVFSNLTGSMPTVNWNVGTEGSQVDWDGDGFTDIGTVAVDINLLDQVGLSSVTPSPGERLFDRDDWGALVYGIGLDGFESSGNGDHSAHNHHLPEFTLEQPILAYQTATGNGADDIVLLRNGDYLEIRDALTDDLLARRLYDRTTSVEIRGVDGEQDSLTVDVRNGDPIPVGGVFFDAGMGGDRIIAVGDQDMTLDDGKLVISQRGTVWLNSTVEYALLTGGASDNRLAATEFSFNGVLLNGGEGDDHLFGSRQGDLLVGGNGDDALYAGLGNDLYLGGAGDDLLKDEGGNDWYLQALAGLAQSTGGQGSDQTGGEGFLDNTSDWRDGLLGIPMSPTSAATGLDTIHDTAGYNTLDLSAAQGNVSLDLRLNQGQSQNVGGGLDAVSIEGQISRVVGGRFNDRLTGSGRDEWIDGGDGHDTIQSGGGSDVLIGGLGVDSIALTAGGIDVVEADRLAVFVVTNTNDDGPGSLRQAILNANAAGRRAIITFQIEGDDPGHLNVDGGLSGADATPDVFRFTPRSPLPALNNANGVIVHGLTQTWWSDDANAFGPEVVLDGVNADDGAHGLTLSGPRNEVYGLNIAGFDGDGIHVDGSHGNTIAGNYIGTDPTGRRGTLVVNGGTFAFLQPAANGGHGISIRDSSDNVIGGDEAVEAVERNVISNNDGNAIQITGGGSLATRITGNYLGTTADGQSALGNRATAIVVIGGRGHQIGGTAVGEGNVISGNFGEGIRLLYSTGVTVQGNFVGVAADGMTRLRNHDDGISIIYAHGNTIGGSTPGARNILSGNQYSGVAVWDGDDNLVQGNYIGVGLDGRTPIGNQAHGVSFGDHAHRNRIIDNVISANGYSGVHIGGGSNENVFRGNRIGTDSTGTMAVGNARNGVLIDGGSSRNVIDDNLVSGNNQNGIDITGDSSLNNRIAGNYIGTTADGMAALGNRGTAIHVIGGRGHQIGGTAAGEGNVISGNFGEGVRLRYVTGVTVQGNYVGVAADGMTRLRNHDDGVSVLQASGNTIGGNAPGARNILSGNQYSGVILWESDDNVVQGNSIGVGLDGKTPVPNMSGGVTINRYADRNLVADNVISGNNYRGVRIGDHSHQNTIRNNNIGTDSTGTIAVGNAQHGVLIDGGSSQNVVAGNLISGNALHGVDITGAGTTGNRVSGNVIGTDATGMLDLGNTSGGVYIANGATNNTIGGATAAERNVISGNDSTGVFITGTTTANNVVSGNYVGLNAAGTAALGNRESGVIVYKASGGNVIGGDTPGERNVISGNARGSNAGNGISVVNTYAPEVTVITGNYVGTNAAGTAAIGNADNGIHIAGAAAQIGTDGDGVNDAAEGNLISGNARAGVVLGGSGNSTMNVVVAGNRIGTNAAGTAALGGHRTAGVSFQSERLPRVTVGSNRIGTNADGVSDELERNVISGNAGVGVLIEGYAGAFVTNNTVAGNSIGTDVTGTLDLGNGSDGVRIARGATHNVIGGSAAAAGNLIAGNAGAGVAVVGEGTAFNTIRANAIVANGGLPIDLGNDGTTANDPLDADIGPNGFQNTPVLVTTDPNGVTGQLQAAANTTFTIDLYLSSRSGGAGEWLGSVTVTTDADGRAEFRIERDLSSRTGEYLTATATDESGNTSELSASLPVDLVSALDSLFSDFVTLLD